MCDPFLQRFKDDMLSSELKAFSDPLAPEKLSQLCWINSNMHAIQFQEAFSQFLKRRCLYTEYLTALVSEHWHVSVLCVLAGLPADTLQGHRDRFQEQFKKYEVHSHKPSRSRFHSTRWLSVTPRTELLVTRRMTFTVSNSLVSLWFSVCSLVCPKLSVSLFQIKESVLSLQ